ncbi:MAG TPA: fatty acid desaturase family protein [Kiritimatiellia bacterium]|nr:fatty acid desaturase family protein [Kiritimatiellia bacterium]
MTAVTATIQTPATPAIRGDEDATGITIKLSPEDIERLSKLQPWRTCLQIALEWVLIAGAIILCEAFWNPLLYIVVVMWMGARQHGLAILMHEGTHLRIFRNRFWNDFVSEVFTAWPIFITTRAYRINHFAHHRFVNTDKDPDWNRKMKYNEDAWKFPKSRGHLIRMLLMDIIGLGCGMIALAVYYLSWWPLPKDPAKRRMDILYHVARVVFYVVAFTIMVRLGVMKEFLLYWIVPFVTWFPLAQHIRSIAEHFAVENEHQLNRTRTTYPSILEKWFLIPNNINYHLDHHLYPSIPFYRLPEAHAILLKNPEFRARAHITNTYFGVLKECTEPPKHPEIAYQS